MHYYRFFGPKPKLTAAEAQYLAAVDFDLASPIVATAREHSRGRVVAVGRFDMLDDETAEAAIVVRTTTTAKVSGQLCSNG